MITQTLVGFRDAHGQYWSNCDQWDRVLQLSKPRALRVWPVRLQPRIDDEDKWFYSKEPLLIRHWNERHLNDLKVGEVTGITGVIKQNPWHDTYGSGACGVFKYLSFYSQMKNLEGYTHKHLQKFCLWSKVRNDPICTPLNCFGYFHNST